MALQLHVNGEASIWVNFASASGMGSLAELGVSVDGVDLGFRLHTDDVMTDTLGPGVPFDVQYFLEEAFITFDLVWWETSVLNDVLGRLPGITPGVSGVAGSLYQYNLMFMRLLIKSTPSTTGVTLVEPCWNFPQAYLTDSVSFKVGTRKTVMRQTWRALYNTNSLTGGAQTGAGLVLYNHVCT